MLRIIQNNSAAGAKRYFNSADYYSEGQELEGRWQGRGAAMLGLAGAVSERDWNALCDNLDPRTGSRLTQRARTSRRVGYDFNFHPPKSVSLLYGLTGDERLLDAFRASIEETMRDIEADAQTRVRSGSRNDDRGTGNLVWGEYVHFTSRPVDGVPDPHLHAHCFVFNATFDGEENRWKAGQFAAIKRDGPYYEALFHSRLARSLADLGMPIERARRGWEIAGFSKELLDRFSRRTAEIEKLAASRGITDPDEKAALGSTTRERKASELAMPELRALWAGRMDDAERQSLRALASGIGRSSTPIDRDAARRSVEHSVSHCFERSAVVPERRLLAEALRHSVGSATADAVCRHAAALPLIRREQDGRHLVTTREVLAEERRMLDFARRGRGACRPLGSPGRAFEREWLDDDQKLAVQHVWESKDRVIMIRGAAGTGKTTMMQEAVAGIETSGHRVLTFAPSAGASRGVLQGEGFKDAETVARLLSDPKLQEAVRGQILWLDEAGLLGSRTMARLFDLADRSGARLILLGDRAQHGSVERGDMLRLLEEEAGLPIASLRQIKRQQHQEYRRAVKALSDGNVADAMRRIEGLGWIKEVPDEDRYKMLARAYLDSTRQPGETLVISPTHHEAAKITAEIRYELKSTGSLGKTEREVMILRPLHLTEAERADAVNYRPGDTLVLHQNIPGWRKGARLVAGRDNLPLEHADRFSVFRPDHFTIAPGDRIRITKNGRAADSKTRLNNGDVFTVRSVSRKGNINLSNGAVLPSDFGHLDYGYVVTSHSSQGRSVDRVILGQSSASFAASSREQAYVSISRGKYQALIFTDDREALLEAVSDGDSRLTATELTALRETDRARVAREHTSHPPSHRHVRAIEHTRDIEVTRDDR